MAARLESTAKVDSSHFLPAHLRKQGYRILSSVVANTLSISLRHKHDMIVGGLTAKVRGKNIFPHIDISLHSGKGIGMSMYEALYEFAGSLGFDTVSGGKHSMGAHRVHEKLSKKYGYLYIAEKLEKPTTRAGYLVEYGPYEYRFR